MTTMHDPITFVCGDSWELTGPLNDADGVPLNLVGATITWKLDSLDGMVNILTLSVGAGITVISLTTGVVLITVTPTQSNAIAPGTYLDWLRVTLATGEVFTEWSGAIRVTGNPT